MEDEGETAENGDGNDKEMNDADWYRQEVGEAPEIGLFDENKRKRKIPSGQVIRKRTTKK